MERAHIMLSGRVQGVGFRVAAKRRARELGLGGWARNLADGRVEMVAEGPSASLDEFIAWCRHGPRGALVGALDIARGRVAGEAPFAIIADGPAAGR